jgi:mRNA interferase RelE/StbE
LADSDPVSPRVRVARKIDALAQEPRPRGVERLKGEENLWRVRAGDFRIIYTIRDEVLLVLVVRVGHRREVYARK